MKPSENDLKENVRTLYPTQPYNHDRAAFRAAQALPGYDNLPEPNPNHTSVGLCPNIQDHEPHLHVGNYFPPFWCEADHTKRLPYSRGR